MPTSTSQLPWELGQKPLMLAPMQGLTNHALRNLLIDWVAPDVVFTEFIRVSAVSRKRVTRSDLRDIAAGNPATPLIAQLVGNGSEALVDAAHQAQAAGPRPPHPTPFPTTPHFESRGCRLGPRPVV